MRLRIAVKKLALLAAFTVITPLCGGTAHAAEVTDMPPPLRADVSVDYLWSYQFGSLEETWQGKQWGYGRRLEYTSTLIPSVEFTAYPGIGFRIAVDTTLSRLNTFPIEGDIFCPEGYGCNGPTQMMFDPVSESGSYANGGTPVSLTEADIPEYKGSGLNGVWLGVILQPFAERFSRNHLVTWRIDLAYRTANPENSWWSAREDGTRGSAPGGSAFKIGAAFSTQNGVANPYLAGQAQHETSFHLDEYIDHTGTSYWLETGGRDIKPADQFDARGGVEIIAFENKHSQSRLALDFYLGFAYRSWEDIPSGIMLPSVLPQSKEDLVTHYDYVMGQGGIGIDAHITKYFGLRVAFDARYITPHSLEHVYAVRSDYDTISMGVNASMDIKIR